MWCTTDEKAFELTQEAAFAAGMEAAQDGTAFYLPIFYVRIRDEDGALYCPEQFLIHGLRESFIAGVHENIRLRNLDQD
jgi:hypothetical protein